MTKRKTAPAATGINPKLAALAAKLDEAKTNCDSVNAPINSLEDEKAARPLIDAAENKLWRLEMRLANTAATNLDGLMLKARYVCFSLTNENPELSDSIVRDLHALDASPRPQPR